MALLSDCINVTAPSIEPNTTLVAVYCVYWRSIPKVKFSIKEGMSTLKYTVCSVHLSNISMPLEISRLQFSEFKLSNHGGRQPDQLGTGHEYGTSHDSRIHTYDFIRHSGENNIIGQIRFIYCPCKIFHKFVIQDISDK